MAFRFILVGVVSCFGLQLPDDASFDGCLSAGRDWIEGRVCELRCHDSESSLAPAPAPAESTTPADDLAFSTLVEEIVDEFAAPAVPEVVAPAPAALPEGEEAPVIALAARPAAEEQVSLEVGTEIEAILSRSTLPDLPESVWAEVEPVTVAVEPAPVETHRAERLSEALKLTGQAMHAWLALIPSTGLRVTR